MSVARPLFALVLGAALSLAAGGAFAQAPSAPPSAPSSAPPAFPAELLQMMQAAQPAGAAAHEDEEVCNASAIASWAPQNNSIDWNTLAIRKVDDAQVHAVKAGLSDAIARLAKADAVALSAADAARFTGVAARPSPAGLTPYLVRAVYPVPDSTVHATWYGDYLEVMSMGEGCAPFTNTPVVVFLDRAPKLVFAATANGHGAGN